MDVLKDASSPITAKYRALYALKEAEGEESRAGLVECLGTLDSVLLLHEAAFALGQRGDEASIAALENVLCDHAHDETTRHEAGEALGAIGHASALSVLRKIRDTEDESIPVRETCQLAVARIELLLADPTQFDTKSVFTSVDPAPSFPANTPPNAEGKIEEKLGEILCDQSVCLFDRYRAMFSLRNIGSEGCLRWLGKALVEDTASALFRHEVAYVLGQLEIASTSDDLMESLERETEHPMVRHEAAEALGAMATEPVVAKLKGFTTHAEPLVADSCKVALDMNEYWAAWKPVAEKEEK